MYRSNLAIILCFIIMMTITFSGCYQEDKARYEGVENKVNYKGVDEELGALFESNVTKIDISTLPESQGIFENFEVIKPEDIKTIIDCFKGIHTSEPKKNPDDYDGMVYLFVFQVDGNKTIEVSLIGNMFIRVNKQIKELSYDEAIVFDKVIGNIALKRYRDNKDLYPIAGNIIKVTSSETGYTEFCFLDSEENKISVSKANIIDITGNGFLVLHEGDAVEVFFKNIAQKDYVADTVFIVSNKEDS